MMNLSLEAGFALNVALLLMLVVVGIAIAMTRSLLAAILLLGVYSLVSTVWLVVMDAADVAFTEAVVGAGVSTIVLLGAILLSRGHTERHDWRRVIAPAVLASAVGGVLVYAALGPLDGYVSVFKPHLVPPLPPELNTNNVGGHESLNDKNVFAGKAKLLWQPNDTYEAYAIYEIVRDRSIMRNLAAVGTAIADSAYSPSGKDAHILIDEAEAKRRRAEVGEEAEFFGSMDGASKFVRGDAVAGILILLINIFGGFTVGVLQHGLSAGQAADSPPPHIFLRISRKNCLTPWRGRG